MVSCDGAVASVFYNHNMRAKLLLAAHHCWA